jgi:hypothetical protein
MIDGSPGIWSTGNVSFTLENNLRSWAKSNSVRHDEVKKNPFIVT